MSTVADQHDEQKYQSHHKGGNANSQNQSWNSFATCLWRPRPTREARAGRSTNRPIVRASIDRRFHSSTTLWLRTGNSECFDRTVMVAERQQRSRFLMSRWIFVTALRNLALSSHRCTNSSQKRATTSAQTYRLVSHRCMKRGWDCAAVHHGTGVGMALHVCMTPSQAVPFLNSSNEIVPELSVSILWKMLSCTVTQPTDAYLGRGLYAQVNIYLDGS